MMDTRYMYIFLLAAGVGILLWTAVKRGITGRLQLICKRMLTMFLRLLDMAIPRKGTGFHGRYSSLLRYSKLSVTQLFRIKWALFALAMLAFILIRFTNINIYDRQIFGQLHYHTDLLYQDIGVEDEEAVFNKEIAYLEEAIRSLSQEDVLKSGKQEIQGRLMELIQTEVDEEAFPKQVMANSLYYRLYDYYKSRIWNIPLMLFIALCASIMPELCILIRGIFINAECKRELRFIKKLIVVNGFIKPVDFMELLKLLINKAEYHRPMLKKIEEMNRRNSVPNPNIYRQLIKECRNLDEKMFFEKLDQANNYDFDQAVINIENELRMEKRTQARQVRKQVELIHAVGIMGFMLLVVILVAYLIIPWLKLYNMNEVM